MDEKFEPISEETLARLVDEARSCSVRAFDMTVSYRVALPLLLEFQQIRGGTHVQERIADSLERKDYTSTILSRIVTAPLSPGFGICSQCGGYHETGSCPSAYVSSMPFAGGKP